MDYNTIKALLDRYFEGETSLEEESLLRQYFQQEDIPAEWANYQSLFQFFQREGEKGTSPEFDEKLRNSGNKNAPLKVISLRSRRLWRAAAAAVILLAAGLWFIKPLSPGEDTAVASIDWSQYEPKSDEEALRLTKTAIFKASKAMRQGIQTAAEEIEGVKKIMQPLK